MLPIPVVLEIRRLLAEGELSQRQIAEQLDVSRGIVQLIASGHRSHARAAASSPYAVTAGQRQAPMREAVARYAPVRCPGCGGLVYLPCLLCRARRHRVRLNYRSTGHGPAPPRRTTTRAA